jgi:uncharacterized protein (DUF1697 family)
MPKHIALLRAVNVGGTGKVPMAELRAMFAKLGFDDAQTLLQSGNVVFDGGKQKSADLEALLEKETEKRFKHRPDYMIRTGAEWKKLVAANPFTREAKTDPGRLVVLPFKTKPTGDIKALRAAIKGKEEVELVGRELYAYYPDGQGNSKLSGALIEKHLGARGTARNWNTVLKLAALCEL